MTDDCALPLRTTLAISASIRTAGAEVVGALLLARRYSDIKRLTMSVPDGRALAI
jgi:hypothetical protein